MTLELEQPSEAVMVEAIPVADWPTGTPLCTPILTDEEIAACDVKLSAMRLRIAMCQLARVFVWFECEAWARYWAAEWTPRPALLGAREEQLARAFAAGELRVCFGR